jgi:Protein of unknown function (DUF1064)
MGWGNLRRYPQVLKVKTHGFLFDSKLEASLYELLLQGQNAGSIQELRVKPNIFLTEAKIRMIPDFCAIAETGQLTFFEAKGFETDVWKIKKKLWKFYGPGPLRIFSGSYKYFRMTEEIIPCGSFSLSTTT